MKEQFEKAAQDVHQLPSRPDNNHLLLLYAYYKQATEGDVSGERPGGFDFKGAAKYDAWASIKGMEANTAMQKYVDLVSELKNR